MATSDTFTTGDYARLLTVAQVSIETSDMNFIGKA